MGWPRIPRVWKPIALALMLGACALGPALDKGAKVYDTALKGALMIKCKAASVGSIERRYMQTQATWELWYKECLGAGDRLLPALPMRTPADENRTEAPDA